MTASNGLVGTRLAGNVAISFREPPGLESVHDPSQLHRAARESLQIENAGGKSSLSEAYSIDFLARRGARDFLFENEIIYFIPARLVDYICDLPLHHDLDGLNGIDDTIETIRMGVSVTRMMGFPDRTRVTDNHIHRHLLRKIDGLIVSRRGVSDVHSFEGCLLHVWCPTHNIRRRTDEQFEQIDIIGKEDVILIATVTSHHPVFTERSVWDGPLVRHTQERSV